MECSGKVLALDMQLESAGEYERTGTTQVVLKPKNVDPRGHENRSFLILHPHGSKNQTLNPRPLTIKDIAKQEALVMSVP